MHDRMLVDIDDRGYSHINRPDVNMSLSLTHMFDVHVHKYIYIYIYTTYYMIIFEQMSRIQEFKIHATHVHMGNSQVSEQ